MSVALLRWNFWNRWLGCWLVDRHCHAWRLVRGNDDRVSRLVLRDVRGGGSHVTILRNVRRWRGRWHHWRPRGWHSRRFLGRVWSRFWILPGPGFRNGESLTAGSRDLIRGRSGPAVVALIISGWRVHIVRRGLIYRWTPRRCSSDILRPCFARCASSCR